MKHKPTLPSVAEPSAKEKQSFDEAMTTVRLYRQLMNDWDSEGSRRPSEQALDFADRLLACLQEMPGISAPFVAPIDDGVFIEWRMGSSNLYLEIDANSVLTVLREGGTVARSTEISHSQIDAAIDLIDQFHEQAE
jgi:hypothetical protein